MIQSPVDTRVKPESFSRRRGPAPFTPRSLVVSGTREGLQTRKGLFLIRNRESHPREE